ncbi:MAG: helix-turn-helix domain-containing protein [bacterium]
MTPAPHIISTIKALMVGYPESHTSRVIDALKRGPRVTVMELARTCKVTRRTIWKWIKVGKLPQPKKQGKRLRFWDYEQVKDLMNAGGSND